MKKQIALIAALAFASTAAQAASRDYIEIVGSSTVYPFATVVAETFGKTSGFKTPKIESTGSGGGLKLFCAGVGVDTPDITNASRRIKSSEVEKCAANGVADVTEVKIGYDGIVMANAKGAADFALTRKDIYMALAAMVPGADGKLVANPNKTWKDVNSSLPSAPIKVIGPPPSSGTRDAFEELALGGGAKKVEALAALRGEKDVETVKKMMADLGIDMAIFDAVMKKKGKVKGKDIFKKVAHHIREDGAYIEAGENDNLIVQKLENDKGALGVFGYSFLEQNSDKVKGATVDGVAPEFEMISDGSYPVSRALFFYVKKAHVGKIPGMAEFLAEFTADKAWGDEGYLADKGMIPMPAEERAKYAADAKELNNLMLK
ncbi:substrate-binding domain-containing protein [Solemya velum gill symbiont]|uniref:ABC-type phosphate transporter PstBACS, subunit S1 n=1 Tax=Solemya velum gill symbiont TaxID=2340 RepID=A0A0B0HBK1_SOVGS|nr:substrate-binding domain-containing protein [Solemya velum gill symbiont]KHF26415.1 ABC-type phosphate transporter PstBACS, subunit S1 [Solemya velum gill symbiont]OOY35508.1 phosphate ABC transporter substrate-binding protein [Solemya velum gill symbiont]OOY38538.1 phosphate ABC transporter substrate-binding protein [Solemya velum gill symbiont]OOY39650.1 phosphate ABC transporter substrate-binding protein [Solemya velum gill symbiont]OOY43343.1 phosphate ABC transporter substrate-binding 